MEKNILNNDQQILYNIMFDMYNMIIKNCGKPHEFNEIMQSIERFYDICQNELSKNMAKQELDNVIKYLGNNHSEVIQMEYEFSLTDWHK